MFVNSLEKKNAEMVFGRKKSSSRGVRSALGDLLVSCGQKNSRAALAVRIHGDVLARLNWLLGDSVMVRRNGRTWTVQRVGASEGVRLARQNQSRTGHGTARFTVDAQTLEDLFPGGQSFTASLIEFSGNEAVFVQD